MKKDLILAVQCSEIYGNPFLSIQEGTAQIIKKPSPLITLREGWSMPLRSFSNRFRLTFKT